MDAAEADALIEQNAMVKMKHGSVLNWKDFMYFDAAFKEADEKLERARALATHLEEIVAMRTAVLAALVEWADTPAPRMSIADRLDPIGPKAIIDWARAQLSEVP